MGAWGKQNQTSRAGRGLCGRRGCAHLCGCSHLQHVRELHDVDGLRCLSDSSKRAARRLVVVDRCGTSDCCPEGRTALPHPTFWCEEMLTLTLTFMKSHFVGRWRPRHRWIANTLSFITVLCRAASDEGPKVARQAVVESKTVSSFLRSMCRTEAATWHRRMYCT